MSKLIKLVENECVYSKEKSKTFAEVFTPTELIIEMLSSLPKEVWKDSTKKWLDPCAGIGNFPAVIITKLMKSLKNEFLDTESRYKHIIENMIYMCEFQKESAQKIYEIFSDGEYNLNLYIGDTLAIPEDFFDLSFKDRQIKYPQHCL